MAEPVCPISPHSRHRDRPAPLIGCGGLRGAPCQTPHIDALAAGGASNLLPSLAICSPARAFPDGHVPASTRGDGEHWRSGVPVAHCRQARLLTRRLQAAGYEYCGLSGKWHLCAEEDKRTRYQADYIMSVPTSLGFRGQVFMGMGAAASITRNTKDLVPMVGPWMFTKVDAAFGHEAGIWNGYG